MNSELEMMFDKNFKEGKGRFFSWGSGYVYNTFAQLHRLPISGIIHTNPDSVKTQNVPKFTPNKFLSIKNEHDCVIIYSDDFLKEAEEFFNENDFKNYIHYKKIPIKSREFIKSTKNSVVLGVERDLIDRSDVSTLVEALDKSIKTSVLPDLNEDEFCFWKTMVSDIRAAFRKHVYFMVVENIEGDIAEFGTCSGTTGVMLANFLEKAEITFNKSGKEVKNIHFFDSFEGLPEVINEYDVIGGWKQGSYKDKTENQLRNMIEEYLPASRVKIYPGWFKDTLSSIPKETKYGLVHIDCDMYEGASDVLNYLFKHEHVAEGCAFFFDDWNCGKASPDLGERRAWKEVVEKYNIRYSDQGEYSIYGRKFIVHMNKY